MSRKRRVIRWSSRDTKQLHQLAGRKDAKTIGRALKRSEAAVRFKAHMERLSLALK